ncbi:hypothetical protein PR048_014470 [Dryococelus australis]|uniref:DDE-1 domain-containing protein n=1 Tax=Dryococelus australis TaxID=614101 RepID=A0ABQ9HEC1_9NEOP|nr:hypothetical protein PR048_014470 [Dryococelus australis]
MKGRRGRKSTSHGRRTALPLDMKKILSLSHHHGATRIWTFKKGHPVTCGRPTKEEVFPCTSYVATENGWMETEVFINIFKISFLAHIGTKRPVLVICDGHKTHVSLRLIEIAREENVTILILPPHSSHILQPLDLSVMKSLKTHYNAELVELQKHSLGQKLSRKEFVKLLITLWQELDLNIIKSGFRKGGIYPFNRDIIPEKRFDIVRNCGTRSIGHICKLNQGMRGSVVRESVVVQAGSSIEGSVVCSEVVAM